MVRRHGKELNRTASECDKIREWAGRPAPETHGKTNMRTARPTVLMALALLAGPAAAPASAQGPITSTEARKAARAYVDAPVIHGSWTRGVGEHSFTACASGCPMTGVPGQAIPLTIEVWGGGGGGASGQPADDYSSGDGGGGGGGGGYGKTTVTVVIPTGGGQAHYRVKVGAGGGGTLATSSTDTQGKHGGPTEFRATNGAVLVSATGGRGGNTEMRAGCSNCGGTAGTGSSNNWGGTTGYPGGSKAACRGGAGGYGGAGGGPGRTGGGYVNDGGNGGNGGNHHSPPICRDMKNWDLRPGIQGGNGKVVLTW